MITTVDIRLNIIIAKNQINKKIITFIERKGEEEI